MAGEERPDTASDGARASGDIACNGMAGPHGAMERKCSAQDRDVAWTRARGGGGATGETPGEGI